jgi:hypothetical protein
MWLCWLLPAGALAAGAWQEQHRHGGCGNMNSADYQITFLMFSAAE